MSCGSCSLCCNLMAVRELEKPCGVWCALIERGGGCSCYNNRPQSCIDFECYWLIGNRLGAINENMRPDKSGVVITDVSPDCVVIKTRSHEPLRFLDNPAAAWLENILTRIPYALSISGHRVFMIAGKTKPIWRELTPDEFEWNGTELNLKGL